MKKYKYISDGTLFDRGSECKLIDDFEVGFGVFEGIRTCINPYLEGGNRIIGEKYIDREICNFSKFDIVEV